MKTPTRVFVAALLLGLVLGMGVHYDIKAGDHWPYPGTDELATEYERHIGEQVFLFGTVQEVDENTRTARIRVSSSKGEFTLTVRDVDVSIQSGGVVQVLGTLQPNYVITAQEIGVVNPAGSSKLYKYGVSLLGALLVAALFFRYWRIDVTAISVGGRDNG